MLDGSSLDGRVWRVGLKRFADQFGRGWRLRPADPLRRVDLLGRAGVAMLPPQGQVATVLEGCLILRAPAGADCAMEKPPHQ